jgi:hypothetical protein
MERAQTSNEKSTCPEAQEAISGQVDYLEPNARQMTDWFMVGFEQTF